MNMRIFAIGEGTGERMVDYAWIFDAEHHKRAWTMRYEDTEHAGGGQKNRLFDGTVRLAAGSYVVYYRSDGSHSADDWNSAPPAEARYWGVSVFPASGRLNRADIAPLERRGRGGSTLLAEIANMGDDEDARITFRLAAPTRVRVYALGEGRDENMFDYGFIADATSRIVWEMKYDETEPAGGSDKNRMFDGVIDLPAGSYVLRYHSDGSHSRAGWNADPPDDPESWGISVYRMDDR
jgi:hypothetical protein